MGSKGMLQVEMAMFRAALQFCSTFLVSWEVVFTLLRSDFKCVYGSVPRAVASVA